MWFARAHGVGRSVEPTTTMPAAQRRKPPLDPRPQIHIGTTARKAPPYPVNRGQCHQLLPTRRALSEMPFSSRNIDIGG